MGINMDHAFPSKWLKAADIEQDKLVTMANVTMEEIGQADHKPVLWLEGFEKGVVLNKTNATNISQLYGADSDGWTGKQMVLSTAYVDFQGKSTLSLRLYPPRPQDVNTGTQQNQSVNTASTGDPRGDIPPATDQSQYGAHRG